MTVPPAALLRSAPRSAVDWARHALRTAAMLTPEDGS